MVHSSSIFGGAKAVLQVTNTGWAQFPADNNDEKNAVLEQLLSDPPTCESPTKRIKTMHSPSAAVKRRSFGEEIDGNHLDAANISMLSMESKETFATQATEDTVSDCATEASSVAMLRGWLDDFGKQSKTHYTKYKTPDPTSLEKPTRPRVARSAADAAPPTPLPPPAAAMIKRIMMDPKRQGMKTPIRMVPKYDKNEVQATDDRCASVAKLSAWLADDPTTTKKVKQIRRGANVIAKSRQFDKGLANVIVEQNHIRSGSVASKKQWIESAASVSDETVDDDSASYSDRKHWLDGRSMMNTTGVQKDSASTFSVSDKKAWLNSAFKKPDGTKKLVPKARTDFVTAADERNDLSSRAKQMWRSRAPSSKRSPVKTSSVVCTPIREQRDIRPQTEVKAESRREMPVKGPVKEGPINSSPKRALEPPPVALAPAAATAADEPPVNFQAARNLLVHRAKTNGNKVEVLTKVKLRKNKFEKMEKESRRISLPTGLLKASWDEADEGRPSNSYTKKYVPDICPKKSFEELP